MRPHAVHPQATAAIGTQPREPLHRGNLEAVRRSMRTATPGEVGRGDQTVSAFDVDAGGVRGRLYLPASAPGPAAPGAVFAHGGGWVMGDLDTHDGLCREISGRSGRAVLAVDYRLAPEHPHPAALEDLERAAGWLAGGGGLRHGVAAEPPAVIGESSGGQLAAVAARRSRDRGRPYAAQILVCPVIDPHAEYPDLDEYGLGREEMDFFWQAYAADPRTTQDPDIAPLLADLHGLPPALVITAELDILRDEAERYAAALAAAGVRVSAVCYSGVNHAFVRKLALFDAAGFAVDQIAGTLRSLLRVPAGH